MKSSIREWLSGKDVLITGGNGYMGKVLVEKLLRSCQGIRHIYLILRGKKGISPESRWEEIVNSVLYSRIKSENPAALEKVIIMQGEVSFPGLGLSDCDREILVKNVSVVFHTAASVRFDDPLTNAINLNTRGTFELVKLAKEMKKLECFEYVSTTYCNANLNVDVIEEKVYDQVHDWRILAEISNVEPDNFNILTKKYYHKEIIMDHPNTYTLSKALAEIIVKEASEELPVVILRPSVVVGCLREPIPGWMDNFNGPVGVTCGVGKGVLRVFKANRDAHLDYVAVDVAINGMIVAAWHKATNDSKEIEVYNAAYADKATCTFDEMIQWGIDVNHELPLDNSIWYPFLIVSENTFYYHLLFYLLQLIPALFLDSIIILARHKPLLLKLNIKIYNAAQALSSFTSRTFVFGNEMYKSIWNDIPEEEAEIFLLDPDDLNPKECMFFFQRGAKKFLLNEKESDLNRLKTKHWRLYYLDRGLKVFFSGICCWYLYTFINSIFVTMSH